jgi:hypothetical protein
MQRNIAIPGGNSTAACCFDKSKVISLLFQWYFIWGASNTLKQPKCHSPHPFCSLKYLTSHWEGKTPFAPPFRPPKERGPGNHSRSRKPRSLTGKNTSFHFCQGNKPPFLPWELQIFALGLGVGVGAPQV